MAILFLHSSNCVYLEELATGINPHQLCVERQLGNLLSRGTRVLASGCVWVCGGVVVRCGGGVVVCGGVWRGE